MRAKVRNKKTQRKFRVRSKETGASQARQIKVMNVKKGTLP